VIGLDTNILARYYVEDRGDSEALAQREAARRLIELGEPLMVCKTVILELEWVMRGYYGFSRDQVQGVLAHLLSLEHVAIEGRADVETAFAHYSAGLDLADALHHSSYRPCDRVATFDDRRFARRGSRMGLAPSLFAPK
jgi:predicted nucleic-acid-binding protein